MLDIVDMDKWLHHADLGLNIHMLALPHNILGSCSRRLVRPDSKGQLQPLETLILGEVEYEALVGGEVEDP